MKPSIKKALLLVALIVLAPLLVFGLGLVPLNLSWLKADLGDSVAEYSGLDFQIHGDLKLRLGFHPSLSAAEVVLNNPAEDGRTLFSLDQLAVKPRIWDILKGNFLFRELTLTGVSLDYCQREFPSPGPGDPASDNGGQLPAIAIDQFQFTDLRLQCSNRDEQLHWMPTLLDVKGALPLDKAAAAVVEGKGDGNEFLLSFSGGSLTELMQKPENFPFQVDFAVPDEIDLSLKAQTEGATVNVDHLEGTVVGISFSLSGLARDFLSRPYLEIDARLEQLDVELLATLFASNNDGETGEMDFQPIYDLLSGFDASLKAEVGQILNPHLSVDGLLIEASLQDRLLTTSGTAAVLEENPVTAELSLDMQAECARLKGDFKTSGINLDHLNPFLAENSTLGGNLETVRIKSDSCGAAVEAHLASLRASLAMSGLTAQWNGEAPPLVVHSLESSINWNEPGQLSLEGSFLDEAVNATAKFGSLDSILSGTRWPLAMELSALDSRLSMGGEATMAGAISEFALNLDLEVRKMGALHPWTRLDPELDLPLTGLASLVSNHSGLTIANLDLKLGKSDLRGSLDWIGPKGDRSIQAEIHSELLDLTELDKLYSVDTTSGSASSGDEAGSSSNEETIEKWLSLPPTEIDLSVEYIRGFLVDAEAVHLQARLDSRVIEDARLDFQLGDIKFDGSLDADLRNRPWNLAFYSVLKDINFGQLLLALDIEQNIDAKASRAEFQIDSEGNSLRELVEYARTNAHIDDLKWVFNAGPENEHHELEVASLSHSSTLSSRSTWQTSGQLNGIPFRAVMKTPPVRETFGSAGRLPITLAINTGNDVVILDANMDRENSRIRHIDLSLSGDVMDNEVPDLMQLQPPLAAYEIKTQIDLNGKELHFSSLEARTGSSLLQGDFRIRYEDPIYGFDLDLHSVFIETEDFVPWVAKWRDTSGQPAGDSPPETEDEETQVGLFALITANIQELAGNNRVKAKLAIDELHSAGELLGKSDFEMEIDGSEFRFDPISIGLPDGHVKGSFTGQANDSGYQYVLKADIRNLAYGGLLRLLDAKSEATGTLFLDIDLESQAPDHEQIPQNLQGTVNMLAVPENAEAGFLDLWASNLIFALLASQEDTGKTMNCMVGLFEVSDGIMETKKSFLDTTDIIVRAHGTIDLVQRELDLLVAPQAKLEKFFSVSAPIKVTGPFDDFKVKVAPGGFMMTMVRWFYGVIYVPWKWMTGERFPADGLETCYNAIPE